MIAQAGRAAKARPARGKGGGKAKRKEAPPVETPAERAAQWLKAMLAVPGASFTPGYRPAVTTTGAPPR